jgi:hypothetical protein
LRLFVFITGAVYEFHGYFGPPGSAGEQGHPIAKLGRQDGSVGGFWGQGVAKEHRYHTTGGRLVLAGKLFHGEEPVVFDMEGGPHDSRKQPLVRDGAGRRWHPRGGHKFGTNTLKRSRGFIYWGSRGLFLEEQGLVACLACY